METLHLIYRLKRYGKWEPITIEVPTDLEREERAEHIVSEIEKEIGTKPLEWQRNDRV